MVRKGFDDAVRRSQQDGPDPRRDVGIVIMTNSAKQSAEKGGEKRGR